MKKWVLTISLVLIVLLSVAAGVYIRGTAAPDFIIDYDNTGAGANTSLIFERGTSGVDASIEWDESTDTFSLSHPVTDFKVIGPSYDVTAYGASGSTTTTTGSITVGTPTLTVASASSFEVDNGVIVAGAGTGAYSDPGAVDDTDQDLSTTGNADDLEWVARKFTAGATGWVGTAEIELGKTGSPAGTLTLTIYSDDGGGTSLPDTQIGGASGTVSCTALSADASGASQEFTWTTDYPAIANGTDYWVVLKSAGYTYANGVTEVRWRTDADGATGLNECAKYESDQSPAWTTVGANVGADASIDLNLISTITVVSGTTITLGDNAGNTVSGFTVSHDDYTAVNSAHTAATVSGGIVFFPTGTYYITSDLSVNNDVGLHFAPKGLLSIADTKTVTVNGHIYDTVFQVFSGDGSVAGAPLNDFVRPEWWGAVGDGVTVCTAAVDKAIKFAASSGVGQVRFLRGTYILDDSLATQSVITTGAAFIGGGYWNDGNIDVKRCLYYNTGHDSISLIGVAGTSMGGATVISFKDVPTDTFGFCLDADADFWLIRDIRITTTGTRAKAAFFMYMSSYNRWENVDIRTFTDHCLYMYNVWGNTFISCKFSVASYLIRTYLGQFNSFIGCAIVQGTIGVTGSGQNYSFIGCDFEGQDAGIYVNDAAVQGYSVQNSAGWRISGSYFEGMGTANIIKLANAKGFNIDAAYISGANDTLYLSTNSTYITVSTWPGDIFIHADAAFVKILNCAGTVTNNDPDSFELDDVLLNDGTTPLTADWDVGAYAVVADRFKADLIQAIDDSGTPTLGDEILNNPTFDAGTTYWADYNSTLLSVAGGQSNNCLRITNTNVNGQARQSFSTDIGAMYYLDLYYKKQDGAVRVYIDSDAFNQSDIYSSGSKYETIWTHLTTTFTATTTTTYLSLLSIGAAPNVNFFDEVSIKRINSGSLVVGDDVSIGDDLTIGGDIAITGTSTLEPSATQVIDAAGDAILANATMVVLNPDDNYTLTATPTIVDGTTGQLVYITAASGETKRVTVQDQDTLGGSNLQLLSPMRTIYANSTLKLEFNGTDWQEISYMLDGGIAKYNIKDFGATGDGIADDTSAIQSAIDAANSAGGGIVFFAEGTYKISSTLTGYTKVSMKGVGDISIINMATGHYPIKYEGVLPGTSSVIEGIVIEDCEDDWTTGSVNPTVDNVDYEVGLASIKFVEGGGSVAGDLLAHETVPAIDLSMYSELKFRFKCSVNTNAGDFEILLDNNATCVSPVEAIDFPADVTNLWVHVAVPLANPGQCTAIVAVGIRMAVDIGAFTLNIDDIKAFGASAGAKTIEVADATDFSAGDYVRIRSEEFFDGGGVIKKGELRKIDSISLNELTMDTPIADTYLTDETATVDLATLFEGISISDLRLKGGGSAENQYGIYFDYVRNLRINNVSIEDFYDRSISLVNCIDYKVSGCNIANSGKAGAGYGIALNRVSINGVIEGNTIKWCRHAVTLGGSTYGVQRYITIDNNNFVGSGNTAVGQIGHHHTCENFVVSNNTCEGDGLISVLSPRTLVIGNTIKTGNTANGYAIYVSANGKELQVIGNYIQQRSPYGFHTEERLVDVTIKDNTFKVIAPNAIRPYGIYFTKGHENVVIDSNEFDGYYTSIYCRNNNATAASANLKITNNMITNNSDLALTVHAEDFDNENTIVGSNIFDEIGSYAINIVDEDAGAGKNVGINIVNNVINNSYVGVNLRGYSEDYRLANNVIYNSAFPVYLDLNASATEFGGSAGRAVISAVLDLSGGAIDNTVFFAPSKCQLVMYDVLYTEASSIDAGVDIRIGRYQDGVALDDDYFDISTSEVSKALGYGKRFFTGDLTQRDLAAGDIVTVGTAGAKAGIGEVVVTLHFCLNAD